MLVTKVFVTAGEPIEIFATGSWTMWEGEYPPVNAEGHEEGTKFTAKGVEWGKLFGGIGSSYGILTETFKVGERMIYTPQRDGILTFYPYVEDFVSVKRGGMDIFVIGGKEATDELLQTADRNVISELNNKVVDRINAFRASVGLNGVEISIPLSESAVDHARYMIINGVFDREQKEGNQGFTGITPDERASAKGFKGKVREIFCQTEDLEKAVDIFIDAVYHRVRLLDPNIKSIGYGNFNNDMNKMHVFVLGYAEEEIVLEQDFVVYPANMSIDVKSSWSGLENPDPLPPNANKPTGLPISVTFKHELTKVKSAELKDENGQIVPVFLITPDTDLWGKNTNSIFMIPRVRTRSGMKYTASVNAVFKVDDVENESQIVWEFTVK